MTTYRLQPAAYRDMEAIWFYTADHYIDGLDETFELLTCQPGLGKLASEFSQAIRIHRHARHLVIYRQTDEGILIIRVLHDSMDINSQLTAPGD